MLQMIKDNLRDNFELFVDLFNLFAIGFFAFTFFMVRKISNLVKKQILLRLEF